MKLLLPTLLLLAAEAVTAFVPTQPSSSSTSPTYAPFFFASEQDTIEETFASAAADAVTTEDTSSSPKSDKDIDWDALLFAASAFGGALAKGVEAAAPVVASAAVDAAFDIGGAASSAVADLQKLNEQAAKNGPKIAPPKIPKISFGWKSSVDVSIPYDAACRLAYEDWKIKYGKTTPRQDDPLGAEKRYQQFRISYDRVTVANVAAKKKVRDAGGFEEARTLNCVELDEYADLTDLEYTEAIRTPTWGEILGDLADVATSVVSKSVESVSEIKLQTPVPPKTKPVKPLSLGKKPRAPTSDKASSMAKPSFSIFTSTSNGVAKTQALIKPKMAMTKMQPTPFFGTAINNKATPAKMKAMTAKEADFAKKIEASRAAKAKALAERKKKEQQRLQKARANFRG